MTFKKYRALNSGEQYPLGEKQLRTVFCDTDIHISLGLTRSYMPDTRIPKATLPAGEVIACLTLSHYAPPSESAHLSLYAIRDSRWSEAQTRELSKQMIPAMLDWYRQRRALISRLGGFDWFFIIWDGSALHSYELHSM